MDKKVKKCFKKYQKLGGIHNASLYETHYIKLLEIRKTTQGKHVFEEFDKYLRATKEAEIYLKSI